MIDATSQLHRVPWSVTTWLTRLIFFIINYFDSQKGSLFVSLQKYTKFHCKIFQNIKLIDRLAIFTIFVYASVSTHAK